MNRILASKLEKFKEEFSLESLSETKLFEYFVNYIIISKSDPNAFSDQASLKFVDVDDKGGTFGLDSFALIVNDTLIRNNDDLDLQAASKRIDATLVFIQSKTSPKFDTGDLLKLTKSVKLILRANKSLYESNEKILDAMNLIDYLYSSKISRNFGSSKPKCEIYFATTSERHETPQTDLESITHTEQTAIEQEISDIKSAEIKCVNSDYLEQSYNELDDDYTIRFNFRENISCGEISNVEQSFIGYLPFDEFIKLIVGSEGNIRKNIFYENVRDFQGDDNSVNQEISKTINTPELIDRFLLLNNGITIVTKSFRNLKSTEYEISNYFIVNGCQTSNVLFRNKDLIKHSERLNIPIKIIHTTNNEFITNVIRSTNRQTPVPDEAFVSLEAFHKKLQDYYKTFTNGLIYERRSREVSMSDSIINKNRIINLHSQIRSFSAVIKGDPHLFYTKNPVTILKSYMKNKDIFNDSHQYAPYYLASMMLYTYFKLQNAGEIDKKFEISRYWICWIARVIFFKNISTPMLDSKRVNKDYEDLIRDLENEELSKKLFSEACDFYMRHKQHNYTNERFTDLVKKLDFKKSIQRELINYTKNN